MGFPPVVQEHGLRSVGEVASRCECEGEWCVLKIEPCDTVVCKAVQIMDDDDYHLQSSPTVKMVERCPFIFIVCINTRIHVLISEL